MDGLRRCWGLPVRDLEPEYSIEMREKIERLADRFEAEFRAGRGPTIDEYLDRNADVRELLLNEIRRRGIELRGGVDESSSAKDYEFRDAINMATDESTSATEIKTRLDAVEDDDAPEKEPLPDTIGRYDVRRRLGRGGFGIVYLAHDPQLNRSVALKIPRRKRFETSEQVSRFMAEARTAANLKHAGLVAVYDVQEEEGLPYIVQEYIDGQHLGIWARDCQPSFRQLADVFVSITEALGYAHEKGLTHCDLKLANVLMDSDGKPHVADFGLAVHESTQSMRRGVRFGTPAAMAPEQVRGEGHRLDGRTDIWAVGVMMYELMSGQRPFSASDKEDLFEQILALDPRPPRQIDRRVPRELDRICLACLSKRRTDRYASAFSVQEDLLAWLDSVAATPGSAPSSVVGSHRGRSSPESSYASQPPPKVIPKGLRSFDAEDADFFLDLLPGPRDRNGLPESIRFWKNRIEETDTDSTFSVGLIYGPSGCGKSSLVKAGLIPRLSEHVSPVYVEATAVDTESRILNRLRAAFPRLTEGVSLADACAEIRITGARRHRKVILIIDQFEQWLHTNKHDSDSPLVEAIRQCDGGNLQCVLMVRDDFWLAVSRFMNSVEVDLVQGQNIALVDLFDVDHAKKVLTRFGQAFGRLPDDPAEISKAQETFVSDVAEGIAQNDKVVSVRLSLFAEMVKGKSWLPSTLESIGGTEGVGVTFLEDALASRASNPAHRKHEKAAQKVLRELLPDVGSDIKGNMRSASELLVASGYENRTDEFDDLIRILDSELRLITPTDPSELDTESENKTNFKGFQLTHDYLVHSLRDWLTRKQMQTRRGRAELALAELSAFWLVKQDNRHLPTINEWARIRTLTDPKTWTDEQSAMMTLAASFFAVRAGAVLTSVLVVVITVGGLISTLSEKAQEAPVRAALERFLDSTPEDAANQLAVLVESPMIVESLLSSDAGYDRQNPLRSAILLNAVRQPTATNTDFVLQRAATVTDAEYRFVVGQLSQYPELALKCLRVARRQSSSNDERARFSAALLYLNDASTATTLFEDREDPTVGTILAQNIIRWFPTNVELLDLVEAHVDETDLLFGLLVASGKFSFDEWPQSCQARWRNIRPAGVFAESRFRNSRTMPLSCCAMGH